MVPPLQIIGAAEQFGRISDLGAWAIRLAAALGISVVAEGVETGAQREVLHRIGCGVLQGFPISRPQPAEGFEPFANCGVEVDAIVEAKVADA